MFTHRKGPPVEDEDEVSDEVKEEHESIHVQGRTHRGVDQVCVELLNRPENVFQPATTNESVSHSSNQSMTSLNEVMLK